MDHFLSLRASAFKRSRFFKLFSWHFIMIPGEQKVCQLWKQFLVPSLSVQFLPHQKLFPLRIRHSIAQKEMGIAQ
uniref:Uncharacterized protein n=1 Tax=Rhizophora mucronata TaxID=61149 RepID=A0A2P2JRK1_RHIMU